MKYKIIVPALVLLIGVCLAGVVLFRDFFTTPTSDDYRTITDLESSYNADAEIAQALQQMNNGREKAAVITRINNGQRVVALTFDGLTDRTTVQQILDLLQKYNGKATFFVDGMQAAEDPQTVVNIKKAGQRIENYTLSGMVKMENLPAERLIKDFSRAQKIIRVTADQGPNLLKCNNTKYTDQLLQAAKACGFSSVVQSDAFLNVKQINSLQAADDFVGRIKPGSIVSIKLKADTEPITKEPGKTDDRPAIDKQPGLKQLPPMEATGEKEVVDAVERLLIALQKANYTTAYVGDFSPRQAAGRPAEAAFLAKLVSILKEQATALITCRTAYAAEMTAGKAEEIKVIPTTEPALSYTFGGLSNEAAVDDILGKLNSLGIKATFFVAEIEMKRYPQTVRKIIDQGHEIGIAIRPKEGESFDEICSTIVRSRTLLNEQFGVTTNLVKQPWGAVTDTTKEAVASLGYTLIGQSVNVVQSRHKDYTSADQVMAEIFRPSMISLNRGEILYFRMDYYTNSRLVGELMESIKQRKVDNIAYATSFDNPAANRANDSQYVIKPVGAILANARFIYHYPADPARIPARLRDAGPGRTPGQYNFLDEAARRYIGNGDVTYEDRMFGFSKMEARRLDTSGLVHTGDNVIFLTFDDWGTDAAVNKILYVLRKHHVPGTFFVLTHNILNNPNLLRAMAVEGHDIACHSDKHKPMVVRDPKTGRQVQTQNKEEYRQELAEAYQKLRAVTGDVTVNGKPALTRFFRPPTLAVSRAGMEALLETGYEYIISGSWSTYDYKAQSVSQLVRTIKDGVYTQDGTVRKGTILVMHMGDACVYTPIALDILLTANEAKADSDPSKFKVGRLSDYLRDGYSQASWKQSLKVSNLDELQTQQRQDNLRGK